MKSTTTPSFEVILEMKQRSFLSKSFNVFTFELIGQKLSYFEIGTFKGSISVENCEVKLNPDEGTGKFPFIIETSAKERIFFNASSFEVREKCMKIIQLASKDSGWTLPPNPQVSLQDHVSTTLVKTDISTCDKAIESGFTMKAEIRGREISKQLWDVYTVKLEKQTLSFSGKFGRSKGSFDTGKCKVTLLTPCEADSREYPFRLDVVGEQILFNCPSEYSRAELICALELSSKRDDWTMDDVRSGTKLSSTLSAESTPNDLVVIPTNAEKSDSSEAMTMWAIVWELFFPITDLCENLVTVFYASTISPLAVFFLFLTFDFLKSYVGNQKNWYGERDCAKFLVRLSVAELALEYFQAIAYAGSCGFAEVPCCLYFALFLPIQSYPIILDIFENADKKEWKEPVSTEKKAFEQYMQQSFQRDFGVLSFSILLGPMLAATSEPIGFQSSSYQVFITFFLFIFQYYDANINNSSGWLNSHRLLNRDFDLRPSRDGGVSYSNEFYLMLWLQFITYAMCIAYGCTTFTLCLRAVHGHLIANSYDKVYCNFMLVISGIFIGVLGLVVVFIAILFMCVGSLIGFEDLIPCWPKQTKNRIQPSSATTSTAVILPLKKTDEVSKTDSAVTPSSAATISTVTASSSTNSVDVEDLLPKVTELINRAESFMAKVGKEKEEPRAPDLEVGSTT